MADRSRDKTLLEEAGSGAMLELAGLAGQQWGSVELRLRLATQSHRSLLATLALIRVRY